MRVETRLVHTHERGEAQRQVDSPTEDYGVALGTRTFAAVATASLLVLSLRSARAVPAGDAARTGARRPLLLGYYVPYDSTSWDSLQEHADQLDIVAAQWVTVNGCGSLASTDDQTLKDFAASRGISVVP